MTAEPSVEESVVAVTQVVLHERQARDRGWWQQMAMMFWPDSTVRLSWYDGDGPGFVSGSRAMVELGLTTVHRLNAPAVHVRGDKAFLEVGVDVRAPVVVDDVAGHLTAVSRLNYRLERRGGEWRIASLDAIYEETSLTPDRPGAEISIPAEELVPFRSTYALLAWDIARRGQDMGDDHLGDDRSDEVDQFYAATWQWLTS